MVVIIKIKSYDDADFFVTETPDGYYHNQIMITTCGSATSDEKVGIMAILGFGD